jgi:hypothetical protein
MTESVPAPAAPPPQAPASGGGGTLKGVALLLVAVGGVLSVVAWMADGGQQRFGFAYLLGFSFGWAIVIGSLFFVALQHVTNSVWSVVLRRAAEALASPMWLLALLFIPLLVVALFNEQHSIFPWMRAAEVAESHQLQLKAPYLDRNFFIVRTAFFFALWIGFAWFFVRGSLRQDDGRAGVETTVRMRKISGPFIILFGLTLTFAAFDWLMSLEPKWFSTIYGVYVFGGVLLSALAAITLLVCWMITTGRIEKGLIRRDHLYSLGGLLFAFTCFWGYIAFSQFMLIWYGNLPEETVYYVNRMKNGWLEVSWLVVVLRFVIPFALLLSRDAKMRPRRLIVVSILVLVGQLADLYWLIMPSMHPDGPTFGWQELGPPVLFLGVLVLYVASFLRRHEPAAVGDPRFEQSRNFHL